MRTLLLRNSLGFFLCSSLNFRFLVPTQILGSFHFCNGITLCLFLSESFCFFFALCVELCHAFPKLLFKFCYLLGHFLFPEFFLWC